MELASEQRLEQPLGAADHIHCASNTGTDRREGSRLAPFTPNLLPAPTQLGKSQSCGGWDAEAVIPATMPACAGCVTSDTTFADEGRHEDKPPHLLGLDALQNQAALHLGSARRAQDHRGSEERPLEGLSQPSPKQLSVMSAPLPLPNTSSLDPQFP